MKEIDKGTRLTNYLIDLFIIFILSIIVIVIFQANDAISYIFYAVMFAYYCIFEGMSGQTLGKLVTKTKVVGKNGEKPPLTKIFFRSFLRLIPFDALSYLFGSEQGIHDTYSRTQLTKK
tara:strand:- start:23529 stop:23885 length:357 start_codon:yes stop_codon:yes gene_type:complete